MGKSKKKPHPRQIRYKNCSKIWIGRKMYGRYFEIVDRNLAMARQLSL